MRTFTSFIYLSAFFFIYSNHVMAFSSDISADEIMRKNFYVSKINRWSAEAKILLINDRGKTRERAIHSISMLQKNGIDSNLVIQFLAPADIKGTNFLQIEHSDADDDLWIYLPALKKSRRLVSNNKKDSFMGTDFSYGDLLPPKVTLYRHTLTANQVINGSDCYVIESVPRNDQVRTDSGYGKKILWIRKDSYLEEKVEYYDVDGRLFKTQYTQEHKLIDADSQRWLALKREMLNHKTGHKTIYTMSNIKKNIDVEESYFSTRTIEKQ